MLNISITTLWGWNPVTLLLPAASVESSLTLDTTYSIALISVHRKPTLACLVQYLLSYLCDSAHIMMWTSRMTNLLLSFPVIIFFAAKQTVQSCCCNWMLLLLPQRTTCPWQHNSPDTVEGGHDTGGCRDVNSLQGTHRHISTATTMTVFLHYSYSKMSAIEEDNIIFSCIFHATCPE